MILSHGTSTIDIGKAQYEQSSKTELIQAKERSASGIVHTEDFSVKLDTYTYKFNDMHIDKYEDLLTFFVDEAEGMMNVFELEDDLSNIMYVKFTEPVIDFANTAYQLFSGSFTVEVEVGQE